MLVESCGVQIGMPVIECVEGVIVLGSALLASDAEDTHC